MRIFMTGATGYIGSAVAGAFVNAGHDVSALVRAGSENQRLAAAGVHLVEGDLARLKDIGRQLTGYELLIHAAHSNDSEMEKLDQGTIEVMLGGISRTGQVLYTSGVWVLGDTGERLADEESPMQPLEISAWRAAHEQIVLRSARPGFTTAVIRPGCVYGGSQSLLAPWFEAAAKGEPLEIIGEGSNRWAMVHLDDVADCYLKIAESGARGIFHAVDDTRAPLREVAEAIAKTGGKGSEIREVSLEESRAKLGSRLADALAVDQQVSSERTRQQLGWQPFSATFFDTVERQWEEWRETAG